MPVLKVVQDGYDTHEAQPDRHAELMRDLGAALHAFRRALVEIGLWDRVTVLTYSEFGRTAAETAPPERTTAPRRRCSRWAARWPAASPAGARR